MNRLNARSVQGRVSIPAIAVLLLAPAALVMGQDEAVSAAPPHEEGWTPALSMQFRTVQGTAISPDGRQVAYVLRNPVMKGKKSEYLSHIWMAAADGSGTTQFTRGEKSASDPAFSPDGNWLAFKANRAPADEKRAEDQIWILPLAGGEARKATAIRSGVQAFRWSPDSTRIAFIMSDPETPGEKKEREEKRDVILVNQNHKYGHLHVVRVAPDQEDIPATVRLTGGEFHVSSFHWAPDGSRIVFAHQPDPRINTSFVAGDLSVVTVPEIQELMALEEERNADLDQKESGDEESGDDPVPACEAEGVVTPLVSWDGVERTPFWSPDGRWVAFNATGQAPEPIGLGDLYVVPAGGGEPRMLAETPNRRVQILAWSGDSRSVFLQEVLGTTVHVIAVPLKGRKIRHVSSGDGVMASVSLTPGGDGMAFTWQTEEQAWDVFISPTQEYEPRQITRLHAGIQQPPMGRTELLTWEAPDGTPVEGLLTYPVDYIPGQRYPLILNVHGGPAGVFTRRFTGGPSIYMIQTFAQKGYAVLRPNPRGSTGYGKDFRYANFKDLGYGDLSDLLAGMDRVIDMGVGDADRQFLMGWSYGGFMTSFAVTRTHRFKAASMGAGLPNLISMTTTTDIGDYLVGLLGGEFWDDYATYEKHSAIYRIQDVVTPTQVIHGQRDLRVPLTQGQEFYRGLERRGVPTEMIVYPRTPHGPREPKFLMDVTGRILTWFEKYMPPV